MKTDNIGGRKFIGFILCMFAWGAVLYADMVTGNFKDSHAQMFLFFLVLVQGVFFGGNLVEKYVMQVLSKGKENVGI